MRGRTIALLMLLVALVAAAVHLLLSGDGTLVPGKGDSAPDGQPAAQAEIFRADFNGDSLIDLAVAEVDAWGKNRTSIYLCRDTTDVHRQYEKIGHIEGDGQFDASAIMSVDGDAGRELVVILRKSDGGREIVRYRSQGDLFVEIERDRL